MRIKLAGVGHHRNLLRGPGDRARQKAYLLSWLEIAVWAVFVFLGGIAGLLVFLAVKEWPVRATCFQLRLKSGWWRSMFANIAWAPWQEAGDARRDGNFA